MARSQSQIQAMYERLEAAAQTGYPDACAAADALYWALYPDVDDIMVTDHLPPELQRL